MTEDQRITSHMPILFELLSNFKIENVLEFGSGFASTGVFCDKCNSVFTIEMQSSEWYDKVTEKYKKYLDDDILILKYIKTESDNDGSDSINIIPKNKKFDLIFVDGARDSRWNVAQYSHDNNLSDIIICHDSEEVCYMYDKIKINEDWERIDLKFYKVWTTVFTNRKDVIKFLNDMDGSIIIKYKNIIDFTKLS